MIETAALIHYGALALTTILTGVGVAIGQGRIAYAAVQAIFVQPQISSIITRNLILALALAETAGFFGLIVVVTVLFHTTLTPETGLFVSIAQAGMICSVGLVGLAVSFATALPATQSMASIARQPFFADNINNLMLITVSIIQTPLIFGVIIIFLIHFQQSTIVSMPQAFKLCAAAICTGIGAIGPALGQGIFASSACKTIGVDRNSYRRLFSFAIVSQSLIETPILLAFIASLLIIYRGVDHPSDLKIIAIVVAALCVGLTNIVPGISSGRVSATACKTLGECKDHAHTNTITRTSMLAQGLIDTIPIYGFIVGILLLTFIAD